MLNIVGYKCSVLETVTSRPSLSVAVWLAFFCFLQIPLPKYYCFCCWKSFGVG